jgi:hypothetical protein
MIFANDFDLGRLVYHLSQMDGHIAPSVVRRETIALGNSAALWSTQVTVTPREIIVGCDARPETLTDRQTLMDRLSRRLGGLLELRTADLPGRFLLGRLADVRVELYPGSFVQPACWVELRFTIPDSARADVEPLIYGLSTSRTACPVGTQASAPLVWVYSCTNPSVVVRAASGAIVSTLALTVTLGSTEALLIDSASQSITRYTAGVVQTGASSGLRALTSGRFPLLSPEDATPDGTAFPTVELTATAGTPTGLILYAERW